MREDLDEQYFRDGGKYWRVSRLIALTEGLPVMDIAVEHLNVSYLLPKFRGAIHFVEYLKEIKVADLSYPVILDEDGYVMDGRHRILRALIEEKKTIKAVRFAKTPKPCQE